MTEFALISRKEALERGLKRYFTGEPCKNGHISERYCSDRFCTECKAQGYKDYFRKNKGKENARSLAYRNKDVERARQSAIGWAKKNPEKKNSLNAMRRSRKIRQTPCWLSDAQRLEIVSIYKNAAELSRKTGTPHHVDHIVPLKNNLVSGLHVPWNLQVITAAENCRKKNRINE